MKYPNPIDTLFSEHLHGKEAYIRAAGLVSEGNIDSKCIMEYRKYSGVVCKSELKWNAVEIKDEFLKKLNSIREEAGLTYDMRDAVHKGANELFDTLHVKVGMIYYHSVVKHEVLTDKDGVITRVDLTYENGTTVEIRNITNIRK
jgi:hypothetical protein